MKKSKYSLIIDDKYLFNTLWGSLEKINLEFLGKWNNFDWDKFSLSEKKILINRKHVIKDVENFNYDDFNKQSKDVSRFYIIFSYDCNLNCTYCFENNIKKHDCITENKLDHLFEMINKIINIRKSSYNELVLFGGEPFLLKNYSLIKKTLEFCREKNIFVSAISNGTTIDLYNQLIREYKDIIKWFSITIDGTEEYNDQRRIGKNGLGTFKKIVKNIDSLVKEKYKVSIRMNIDKNNVANIPLFLNYMRQRYQDKVEISLSLVEDNTEVGNQNLLNYEDITKILINFDLLKWNNDVEINIKPVNKINELLNKKEKVLPLFKYCWMGSYYTFTPSGEIFTCPESCECKSLKIGDFYPTIGIDENKMKYLLEFNSLKLNMCKECGYAPICGSGCYMKRLKNDENLCYKDEITRSLRIQINEIERQDND